MSESGDWPYPVKKFVCHQCGNCCRGDGYVEMTASNLKKLSAFFKITEQQFIEKYCRPEKYSGFYILKDQQDALQSCIFLTDDNRCEVHEAKPDQCKDFPMRWRLENIADYCDGWRAMEGLPPSERKKI